jgi:hypothetical protein
VNPFLFDDFSSSLQVPKVRHHRRHLHGRHRPSAISCPAPQPPELHPLSHIHDGSLDINRISFLTLILNACRAQSKCKDEAKHVANGGLPDELPAGGELANEAVRQVAHSNLQSGVKQLNIFSLAVLCHIQRFCSNIEFIHILEQ